MANLEEILKNIDNMKPEDLYLVLQNLGYDGDANELKQEIEKLFDEEKLEFVSGGQNELSRRVGAGILGLLPIVTSITSDTFANNLNNSVTTPVSKNINKNNSKKINWQDIKNKGKQFAKEMNLPDKKTLDAFGVTSLVALAIGYGLNSLTTPSKTVELSPEKMNKVQELATSSAQKDFKNKNFEAWKSGLIDLLINWFFDVESIPNGIDLSVDVVKETISLAVKENISLVAKKTISLELLRSETWLDNIYVNYVNSESQDMPLRSYIEQTVKNKKYKYSPNLLVYLLGVYNSTYIQTYNFVKLEVKKSRATEKIKACVGRNCLLIENNDKLHCKNQEFQKENLIACNKVYELEKRLDYLCELEKFYTRVMELTALNLESDPIGREPIQVLQGVLESIVRESLNEKGQYRLGEYEIAPKAGASLPTASLTLEDLNSLYTFTIRSFEQSARQSASFNDILDTLHSLGVAYSTEDILRACRLSHSLIMSACSYLDKNSAKRAHAMTELQQEIKEIQKELKLTELENKRLELERGELIKATRKSNKIYDNRKHKQNYSPTDGNIDSEKIQDLEAQLRHEKERTTRYGREINELRIALNKAKKTPENSKLRSELRKADLLNTVQLNKIKNQKNEINSLTNKLAISTNLAKLLPFALEVAYKYGLNPPVGEVGSVAAFSWVLDDILKQCTSLEKDYIVYYNVGGELLLDSEPLTMHQLGQYYDIRIAPDGDSLPFTEGIKVLQEKYGLPFDKNFMLTLAQSCQKVFLSGAEKANEFDRLNREVARMYAGYDYQFDDVGHTYHPEDYNKKKLKDKMNVNSRRKKEHKTTETFERFMRKVASKERQNFGDSTFVEISELINCIDDPETKKLFSDKRNDYMNKRKIKSNTKIYDYNDIYLGELPENENYLDIDGSGNTNQNYKHELEELSSDNEDYSVSDDEDTQNSESNEEVATYDSNEYDENSQDCVQNSDSDNDSAWFASPEERDYSEKDESENEPQENNQNSVTEEYTDDIQDKTSFDVLDDSGEDLNDEKQMTQELDEN